MEKVVIQFEPALNDYYQAIRSFLTRKRWYWVGLGASSVATLFVFLIAVASFWDDDLRFGLYLAIVFLLILPWMWYPFWGGWFTIRNAAKKEHLTLPVKYEFDDEQVSIDSQMTSGRVDWKIFDQAFEDGQYFLINYSTNKNMFHFIPKRAFASMEQEIMVRNLLITHLGGVEDTRQGLTGWKLALLAAALFFVLMLCVIVGTAIVVFVLE